MNVTIHGLPFSVDLAGEGEPILFVHGFPLNRRMWQAQTTAFGGTNRVIAPDLRGFGESAAAPPAVTMEEYADHLAALLDEINVREPVTLCGLSMGGYVAFAFFRRHRERIARLVLCDTKAAADSPEKKAERDRLADEVLRHGTGKLVREMPCALLAERTLAERPSVVAAVRELIAEASPAAVAAALRGMAMRPDSTDILPKIDVPTLVICGEEDTISPPAEMQAMAEAIPQAIFSTIPSAGHLAPMENPEPVNGAIRRFLGEG
jgi:3-oxoadipate enol-lactonase